MGSPAADLIVSDRLSVRQTLGGRQGFVRDFGAMNARDEIECEVRERGCEGEGVELVCSFGEVDEEYLLELWIQRSWLAATSVRFCSPESLEVQVKE